ncbi:hypothetical protein Dimus_031435 [Dionaea muscipula]
MHSSEHAAIPCILKACTHKCDKQQHQRVALHCSVGKQLITSSLEKPNSEQRSDDQRSAEQRPVKLAGEQWLHHASSRMESSSASGQRRHMAGSELQRRRRPVTRVKLQCSGQRSPRRATLQQATAGNDNGGQLRHHAGFSQTCEDSPHPVAREQQPWASSSTSPSSQLHGSLMMNSAATSSSFMLHSLLASSSLPPRLRNQAASSGATTSGAPSNDRVKLVQRAMAPSHERRMESRAASGQRRHMASDELQRRRRPLTRVELRCSGQRSPRRATLQQATAGNDNGGQLRHHAGFSQTCEDSPQPVAREQQPWASSNTSPSSQLHGSLMMNSAASFEQLHAYMLHSCGQHNNILGNK